MYNPIYTISNQLSVTLANRNTKFTAFIPNNAAFRASQIPSIAAINSGAFSAGKLDTLLRYHLIPGQIYFSTDIPTTFPNIQLPSLLSIGTLPGTSLPINLPIYPSRRTTGATGFWANNIPVVTPDIKVQNGVMHITATLVAPPSLVLAQLIYADPNYSLFVAAIARGDSGQVGLNRIDSVFKFPLASITFFAPNNAAFNAIGITTAAQINAMPVQSVRGLVVNHLMGSKAFSVNFANTFTFYPTLLSGGIPGYPGVKVQTTFAGGFGVAMQVQSVGMGTAVANVTALDRNCINGVVHNVDKVLLP